MMLTDREWLRFVTFALITGGILGSITTAGFLFNGMPPMYALIGAVLWTGAVGAVLHLVVRKLVDMASEPPAEEPPEEPEPETHA